MKILLLTHFYPPGHLGGTEVLTAGLAKSLLAKGHEVHVVCGESWDSAPSHRINAVDDEYQGVPVHRLHFNWTKAPDVFRYLYNNPEVTAYLDQFIEGYHPDVIHITSCYTLSASVIELAQNKRIPTILSATDFWFLCARNTLLRTDNTLCPGPEDPWECARCLVSGSKFQRWTQKVVPTSLQRQVLKTTGKIPALTNRPGLRGMLGDWEDRFAYLSQSLAQVNEIVTASHFLLEKFIQFGVDSSKISYSSYGLDTSWAKGFGAKKPSDTLRLGFIGQILPFKGPDLLIKAVTALTGESKIQVKIYGDLEKTPDYGKSLRQLAGDDFRITFPGTFENSRMGEILSEIDVLVVPSTWYDFPLVIPSALATRTPVITTNLPGMNEQIQHGFNGLLFERFDWQGLNLQIQRLLGEPELLNQLRVNIQPIKTIEEMTDQYLDIYARYASM